MISVIVPVYNVEPYLGKCLNSIVNQTYRDIEIILVNDGSTDGSRRICEDYRSRDDRVNLFNTENHGLSAARNLGIDHAHGEWLMFVDSDDWVEPEFCAHPCHAAVDNNADLVIFEFTYVGSGTSKINENNGPKGIITAEDAIDYGHSAVWNKLYHRTLFDSVRYPEGRLFEDTAVTHRVVYRANRILMLDEHLYNYRKREDSITGRIDEKREKEFFMTILQKYDDLLGYGYPKEKLELNLLRYALRLVICIEPSDDPLYKKADMIVSDYGGNTDELKPYERNALKIWRLNKTLFHNIYRINGKKVK